MAPGCARTEYGATIVRERPVWPVSMNTRSPRPATRRSIVDNSGCRLCKSRPTSSTSVLPDVERHAGAERHEHVQPGLPRRLRKADEPDFRRAAREATSASVTASEKARGPRSKSTTK